MLQDESVSVHDLHSDANVGLSGLADEPPAEFEPPVDLPGYDEWCDEVHALTDEDFERFTQMEAEQLEAERKLAEQVRQTTDNMRRASAAIDRVLGIVA